MIAVFTMLKRIRFRSGNCSLLPRFVKIVKPASFLWKGCRGHLASTCPLLFCCLLPFTLMISAFSFLQILQKAEPGKGLPRTAQEERDRVCEQPWGKDYPGSIYGTSTGSVGALCTAADPEVPMCRSSSGKYVFRYASYVSLLFSPYFP